MNDTKITKILIVASAILILFGMFMFFAQGWFSSQVSFNDFWGNIFSLTKKTEKQKIGLWEIIPELAGLTEEKTYLILFQNNLELRPSGGYLGNFGILKVYRGKIVSLGLHDTNIFDGFGKKQTEPPVPLKKYLNIDNWQMRDSNWSPDFTQAAKKAEYFYHLQGGEENFDGIIGINASILPVLLEYTGSITIEEFGKTFKPDNALYELEYEIEKGYVNRGINKGERKIIFKKLVRKIVNKIESQNLFRKAKLKDLLIQELNKKNIQLFFKNDKIQSWAKANNWTGKIKQTKDNQDYLMIVEANLRSKKSNYFVKRKIDYSIDKSSKRPIAHLRIKYSHSNPKKNWFNDDYGFYLRVYVPSGSWLLSANGVEDGTRFLDEFNKTVFGNWVEVPAGTKKTIEFKYLLPAEVDVSEEGYDLIFQKQSGVDEMLSAMRKPK